MCGHKRKAFTLVELLVVIAILGALMAILLPALGKARDSAKRTVCGTNLKGQGTAMATYSSGFGDTLPIFKNMGANWLHDEPVEFGDALITTPTSTKVGQSSPMRKWFYCPANEFLSDESGWSDSRTLGTNPAIPGYRMFGYNYLNDRGTRSIAAVPAAGVQRFTKAQPDIKLQRTWNPRFAGNTEVIFDQIWASTNRGTDYDTSGPHGGYFNVATSHLRGKNPAGQNILFLDGHVEWKVWSGLNKATCLQNLNGQAYVYLIDP